MSRWVDSKSHVVPAVRLVASLVVGLILAGVGGLVLGEYTFQGVGIQWLAISGGAGLGAAMAWVLNRVWSHDPPLWMMPVAAVLSGLVDFAIGLVVMVILTLSFGIHPPASVLLLPILIVLAILTALGVGLWTSALNALYRDVRAVMPFVVQFWMLASPVAYPSSLVPARWRWLYGLNPMAGVIDGFRWALTGHGQPPGAAMAAAAVGVCVVLLGGLFFFQRMETNIADRV